MKTFDNLQEAVYTAIQETNSDDLTTLLEYIRNKFRSLEWLLDDRKKEVCLGKDTNHYYYMDYVISNDEVEKILEDFDNTENPEYP